MLLIEVSECESSYLKGEVDHTVGALEHTGMAEIVYNLSEALVRYKLHIIEHPMSIRGGDKR